MNDVVQVALIVCVGGPFAVMGALLLFSLAVAFIGWLSDRLEGGGGDVTDNPHAPHLQWLWVASCSLCGWRSPRFDSQNIARGLAILHAAVRHPYGHTTIGAVDRRTAFVNDALDRYEQE